MNDRLLTKQTIGNAVSVIQDIITRWWSTFSMVERLIRLKPYFAVMEAEGFLNENLTVNQWQIIQDIKDLLQPFMAAQMILEGEKYVTLSLVPGIIDQIRRGLQSVIARYETAPRASHVASLATSMLEALNESFGTMEDGTLWAQRDGEGFRRRPKGFPTLTLLAVALDPRTKNGPGIGRED